jgi:hypothetical protein
LAVTKLPWGFDSLPLRQCGVIKEAGRRVLMTEDVINLMSESEFSG